MFSASCVVYCRILLGLIRLLFTKHSLWSMNLICCSSLWSPKPCAKKWYAEILGSIDDSVSSKPAVLTHHRLASWNAAPDASWGDVTLMVKPRCCCKLQVASPADLSIILQKTCSLNWNQHVKCRNLPGPGLETCCAISSNGPWPCQLSSTASRLGLLDLFH
jgi:hypothetical protein